MSSPFITFITPTYRRPQQLAACLASVGAQTAVADIEQIVLPDHVGLGIVDGLYGRLPHYVDAIHGRYVHVLADDDVLASPTAVAEVKAFAEANHEPPVIVVRVRKGHMTLPGQSLNPPVCGAIDMGCLIQRADIYRRFVSAYCTGRYEGDFDHAHALWKAGIPFAVMPSLFVVGAQSHGRPEVAA